MRIKKKERLNEVEEKPNINEKADAIKQNNGRK